MDVPVCCILSRSVLCLNNLRLSNNKHYIYRFEVYLIKTKCIFLFYFKLFKKFQWKQILTQSIRCFPSRWVFLETLHHLIQTMHCVPSITFIQRRPNVFDVGPTLYKCYTNVFVFTELSYKKRGSRHVQLYTELLFTPITHHMHFNFQCQVLTLCPLITTIIVFNLCH